MVKHGATTPARHRSPGRRARNGPCWPVRNRQLADACYQWAFCALTASAGARAFYDEHRAKGETHDQALRVLSNRLVGILDGCLRNRAVYDEQKAWGHRSATTTSATSTAAGLT
jgi:hypothetical protein